MDNGRHRGGHRAEYQNFAEGVVRDWPEVSAALQSRHSNGRAEGHVNRLKLLKR